MEKHETERLIKIRDSFAQSIALHLKRPARSYEREVVKLLFPAMVQARASGWSLSQIRQHIHYLLQDWNLSLREDQLTLNYQDAQFLHMESAFFKAKEEWKRVLNEASGLLAKIEVERQCIAGLLDGIRAIESRIFPTNAPRKYQCKPLKPWVTQAPEKSSVPIFVYAEGNLEHPAIPGLLLNKAERLYSSYLEIEDLESRQVRFETMAEKLSRLNWVVRTTATN